MRAIATAAILGLLAGCGGAPEKKETPAPAPAPTDPHADMGKATMPSGRPWLGANPDYGASDRMKIGSIAAGSPAEKAGLKPGEEIVEFDGADVGDLSDYSQRLFAKRPGDTVRLRVLNGDQEREVKVTLGVKGLPEE